MLAHTRIGSGIPLVFIHAFPLSRDMWSRQVDAFSRNFQPISIDLPGFGQSPSESRDVFSMDDYADAVLACLDGLGVREKAVFTGVSMGGYILFRLVKKAPDRVRAMVLASTRSAADTPEARNKRFQTIDALQKGGIKMLAETMPSKMLSPASQKRSPQLTARVRQWIEAARPESAQQALRGMAERPDSTGELASISVPTLVLAGQDDPIVPAAEMKEMASNLPKGRFEEIPGAAHLINLENPAVFEDRYLKFLKRAVL